MPSWLRVAKAAQSALFTGVLAVYLVFCMGLIQRAILVPLTWAWPSRRDRIMGPWGRFNTRNILFLLKVFAGVRMTLNGSIEPGSAIFIMNHQSLVDIPIGYAIIPNPIPLMATRRRYARGIPGVSLYCRLARLPLVTQTKEGRRADLAAIVDAIDRTVRGETSFFIFPEGHRTKDGSLLPFMSAGLRLALRRIRRPVYCIVADGMWHVRTVGDTIVRVAGSHIQVRILGPFTPPAESEIPDFIDAVHDLMQATLGDIRGGVATTRSLTMRNAV